jgi:hypothetical protein
MLRHILPALLVSLAASVVLAKEPLNPSGRWLLTMPAGFEYNATLEPGPEAGLYRLRCGAVLLQGLYELRGKRLTMAQPVDPKLVGLVWEVKNRNTLVLVEHPEKAQFGSDYRGATLGRQKQAQP